MNKILTSVVVLAIIFLFAIESFADGITIKIPGTNSSIDITKANPDSITNPDAPYIAEFCREYPGFINKIVQCVTHLVTQGQITSTLNRLNAKFAGAGMAALILYVTLFSLKLTFNAVEDARGEIMTTLITCFFVTYCLNSVRMDDFIRFFTGLQNEFVSVAQAAIYTKEDEDLATLLTDPNYDSNSSEYICYGPKNSDGKLVVGARYTIWQRMDCLFGYVLGAHPIVQYMGQYFDPQGKGSPGQIPTDLNQVLYNYNKSFSYDLFAGPNNPFAEMAEDPYCFFRYSTNLDISFNDAGDALSDTAKALIEISQDSCYKKLLTMPVDKLLRLARVVKNNRNEVFMSFSMVVMLIGMLFNDPSIGLVVFVTGFFVVFLMFAAFAQTATVYITSLLVIFILGLFAPLIIPCFLFNYTRKKIFMPWVQLMIVYSLQSGIMMCYITFMLLVIQYSISYNTQNSESKIACLGDNNSPDCQHNVTCDPNKDAGCTCTGNPQVCTGSYIINKAAMMGDDVRSLTQYQGDLYTQSDINDDVVAEVKTRSSTGVTDLTTQEGMIFGAGSTRVGDESNPNYGYSVVNYYRGNSTISDQMNIYATEVTPETKRNLFNIGIQNTGVQGFNINLPSFNFGPGTLRDKLFSLFLKYDPLNTDIQSSLKNAQQNQIPGQDIITDVNTTVTNFHKDNFRLKIGYLQSLLVLLITLALTFAFLNNIMDFAGKLAGAAGLPMKRMFNVYGMMSKKMSKFLS